MAINRFRGEVWDKSGNQPGADLRVEALDVRGRIGAVVAEARTDAQGVFVMSVDDGDVALLFRDGPADVFFRVSNATPAVLASTEKQVRWNVRRNGTGRIDIDSTRTAGALPSSRSYIVEGIVADESTGAPSSGKVVEVFKRTLTLDVVTETSVASMTTQANGRYRLAYDPGSEQPDVIVRAKVGTTEVAKATLSRAPARATVDLLISGTVNKRYVGPSRYDMVLAAVNGTDTARSPRLETFGATQIGFVAGQAALSSSEVQALVDARKLNVSNPSIAMSAFYAFMRQGIGASGDDVFAHRTPVLRRVLEDAVSNRLIPASITTDPNLTANLRAAGRNALRQSGSGKLRLGTLVDNAPGTSAGERDIFLDLALDAEGTGAEFWASVEANLGLSVTARRRFRFAVEASAIAGAYFPMVQALHTRITNSTLLDDARELAKYKASDWDTVINGLTGVPLGTPGANLAAQRINYRDFLLKSAESRYRSVRIKARVVQDEVATSPLRRFFEASVNAGFEFENMRVGRYLVEVPTALATLTLQADKDEAVRRLRDIERLFHVTESWDEVSVLLGGVDPVKSSHAIHQLGRDAFLAKYPTLTNASAIYDKACWRGTAAAVVRSQHSPRLNRKNFLVLPDGAKKMTSGLPAKLADWDTLFGSLDQCVCEHCRSVLSPGAYLVDVLEMLERVPKTGGGNARDSLLARRPDLDRLALSCENALTPLPTIDVVNEILEVRLAAASWPNWPAAPLPIDTLATAEELAAQPEVLYPLEHATAYITLATAPHPLIVPFHLWQEEARVYLEHLGLSRDRLIEKFAPTSGANSRHLAIERLRIAPAQFDTIAMSTTPAEVYRYWGLSSAGWPASLSLANTVMVRAGLTFAELQELFATAWANANGVNFPTTATCDLNTLTVDGLTTDALRHYLHRFVRLRAALGTSITDAGRLVDWVGTSALDTTALQKLASLKELWSRLRVSALTALAWFTNIDRLNRWERSLFERVFLDKKVQSSSQTVFAQMLTVNTDLSSTIASVRSGLSAALGLTDRELGLLIDPTIAPLELALDTAANATLNSTNFLNISRASLLYRLASFSQALGRPLKDTLVLRHFSGLNVLQDVGGSAAVPDTTLSFLRLVERFDRTGLTVDEVHYLVRHVATLESALEPTTEQLKGWDAELLLEIEKAANEAKEIADVDGSRLKSLGALLLSGSDASELTALANDTLASSPATTFIQGSLSRFLGDTVDAVAKLVTVATKLTGLTARAEYLSQRLGRYVACRAAVLTWVSRTFGVDTKVAAALLSNQQAGGVETSILRWVAGVGVGEFIPLTQWAVPNATEANRLNYAKHIHKVARFVTKLGLGATELDYLYPLGAVGFFDLRGVPTARPAAAAMTLAERNQFAAVLRLGELVWLRDRYPAGGEALVALLKVASTLTLPAIYTRLAAETSFLESDLSAIARRLNGGVDPLPAAFGNEQLLVRIFDCMEVVRRFGASGAQIVGWLDPEAALPTASNVESPAGNALLVAREIKSVARAKADDASWAKTGRALRDPLREKQRGALVGLLLTNLNLTTPTRLFEELLIDVETSPCALTSRLVAANGSLQSFTNRLLLNLEPTLPPTKQLAREWEWMRAYRLWEANRKVFLWPENWIEPELRADKTPLFTALETALLEGPLTHDNAEKAYRAYLDGLAEVGHLEVVGLHTEKQDQSGFSLTSGNKTRVHVIGRTPKPHRYFHRMRDSSGWSPWRKLDVDVQGEHILPASINGRLYLFWAAIEDKPKQVEVGVTTPGNLPELPIEIQQLEALLPTLEEPARTMTENAIAAAKANLASTATLQAAVPAPLGASVTISVAELREGAWSTVSAATELIPLEASPARFALSLTNAETGANNLTVKLLYAASAIGEFVFDPGTRRLNAKAAPAELTDSLGSYGSNILCTVSPQTVEVVNPNGFGFFQRFNVIGGKFKAYVSNVAAEPKVVFSAVPSWTQVVMNRGKSTEKERSHYIVQDPTRSLYVELTSRFAPTTQTVQNSLVSSESGVVSAVALNAQKLFAVQPFYHPFINDFRRRLAIDGLDGLLRPSQLAVAPQEQTTPLTGFSPTSLVSVVEPLNVDFRYGSPYGVYNWELFFHAPLLIATRLTQEGKFAEARDWFHTIFDPTDGSTVPVADAHTRYWKFKPFADNKDLASIQAELQGVAQNAYAVEMAAWADAAPSATFSQQVHTWRNDPFDPHAIARIRILAYQKAVVQKYIENLLQWGDYLFAQDTLETINEAAQLYLHALQILGPKPNLIPDPKDPPAQSYEQLGTNVDVFGNAVVDTEVIVPPVPPSGFVCNGGAKVPVTVAGSTYFCVPENEKLFGYWDTISDRLFKIRHCQNLEGVVRALPLFQPPIDPALLVRARAAGLDLGSVMNDLNVATPPYRYSMLAARAGDYVNALTSLGNTLLSALEKKDGEQLTQLRASHDIANQELSREIRRNQLQEARENLESAKRSLATAEARRDYYESRDFMSAGEITAMTLQQVAEGLSVVGQLVKTGGAQVSAGPDGIAGGAGISSPVGLLKYGAENVSRSAIGAGEAFELGSRAVSQAASITSTLSGYQRRMDDWKFQANQAKLEIAQLEKQVLAAEIRAELANQELRLLEQQLRQSKEVESFLRTKFTSQELYGWMVGQLSAVYHQSYKLAYEMARQAERAFQHERGDTSQTFIKFGAWDGFRKGLLAGEKLGTDLRRMDAAYHTQNKREHEIVKTISIAQLDPDAFMKLREAVVNGAEFTLPMSLFDDDFPTHHMRRLKNVNVSLQCTPGPYQSVNGSLTLSRSETLLKPTDTSATQDNAGVALIATSGAANDTGLFELNFRDERYLPFEYRGVHSQTGPQWRFELTGGNEFNYDSITDLVMQLRYTAREGRVGTVPKTTSKKLLWRIPQTNPDAWAAFKEGAASFAVTTSSASFPKGKNRTFASANPVSAVSVYARYATTQPLAFGTIAASPGTVSVGTSSSIGNYKVWQFSVTGSTPDVTWTFTPTGGFPITDLWVAFTYSLT